MFHRLREPFGKAGLIVAMVALVAAVGGSAIAANTASDSGKRNAKAKKKRAKGVTVAQVRKIAKQEAQKFANSNPGAPGLQGPAGANGNDGQNGSNGSQGSKGDTGPQGPKGDDGDPGPQGIQGIQGEPWTPDNTLPEDATLTGAYFIEGDTAGAYKTAISFPVPLAAPIDADHIQGNRIGYPASNQTACEAEAEPEKAACLANLVTLEENCPGTGDDPQAASGFLCVYIGASQNIFPPLPFNVSVSSPNTLAAPPDASQFSAGVSGAILTATSISGVPKVTGTYAVTG